MNFWNPSLLFGMGYSTTGASDIVQTYNSPSPYVFPYTLLPRIGQGTTLCKSMDRVLIFLRKDNHSCLKKRLLIQGQNHVIGI
jgi:hypothetical protein